MVNLAQSFELETGLGVLGTMHSFVGRCCREHHVIVETIVRFFFSEEEGVSVIDLDVGMTTWYT